MKKLIIILLSLIIILIYGCGKSDTALDDYYNSMEDFVNNMDSINEELNNLSIADADSKTELLALLDETDALFTSLSQIEVPDEFHANKSLSQEAAAYMSEAVRLYHVYYEDESAGMEFAEAAKENYNRAMIRISVISTILMGETPTGDNIVIEEDDTTDFEPVID